MTRRRTVVDVCSTGWPLAPNEHGAPGIKHCFMVLSRGLSGLPPCTEIAALRVTTLGSAITGTAYYCAQHRRRPHRTARLAHPPRGRVDLGAAGPNPA